MLKRISLIMIFSFMLLNIAAQVKWDGATDKFSLSPLKTPPVIDGKFNDREWNGAIEVSGFFVRSPLSLALRGGRCLVGYDSKNLYIAVLSELPPDGKPVSTVRHHDGKVFYDDNIEIWLDPARDVRNKGKDHDAFYQLIINSLGTICDIRHSPDEPSNENWNCVGKCSNTLDKELNMWVMELELPWSQFGIKEPSGKDIGLLISRNWKRPSQQNPWSATMIPFNYVKKYPVLQLREAVPTVRIKQLGDIFQRKLKMECELYNPSLNPLTCSVEVTATHTDMPSSTKNYPVTLPPFKTQSIVYTADSGKIHDDAGHTVTVKCKVGQYDVFSREIKWNLPVDYDKRWRLSNESAADFFFSYYPSMNRIAFKLNGKISGTILNLKVIDSAGKEVDSKNFKAASDKVMDAFNIPALADGKYELICRIIKDGRTLKTLKRSFVRRKFEWEGNKIGISDKVYPPFTYLQVSGHNVSMILREYRINDFGLLDSAKSEGRELLAAPMSYVIDGKWQSRQSELARKNDSNVVFESSDNAGKFMLKTTSSIEYDGCVKVATELIPLSRDAVVKQLYLDIPLKSDYIRLMHIIKSDTIRTNPAIKVPTGEGIVWKSTDNGNGYMLGNMHPYIWLGHMARGVAWFADNDKNWNVDDNRQVQELIRKDGVLTLRIKFVDLPLQLSKPRTIVFGLQVSPVKPMPSDWRQPSYIIPAHGGSNPYWGMAPAYAGKYPVDNDWKIVDEMRKTRESGNVDSDLLDKWLKEKYGTLDAKMQEYYRNHIRGGFYGMLAKQPEQPKLLYFEEHCQDRTSPEWIVFQDEWGVKAFTGRVWYDKIDDMSRITGTGIRIAPYKSYQDFALWNAAKWNRSGIGVYCDNSFPRNVYDTNTSDAYCRKDGQIQPSSGIWDMREYHKRLWIADKQLQPQTKYPLLKSMHITNGMIIPVVGWSDILLDLEWVWKGGQAAFPPELLEIESTGRQAGAYPHVHYFIVGPQNLFPEGYKKPFDPHMLRAEWGMRTVYEILRYPKLGVSFEQWDKIITEFGYGSSKCKVLNYWDDNYPVKIVPDSVKSILLENNNKYMLVIQGWNEEPTPVTITFKGRTITRAVNAENKESFAVKNGKIDLEIKRYGMRIINLEFAE